MENKEFGELSREITKAQCLIEKIEVNVRTNFSDLDEDQTRELIYRMNRMITVNFSIKNYAKLRLEDLKDLKNFSPST